MLVSMYIQTVPGHNSRPAILLREGWRDGKMICKRTLANLTDWSAHKIERLQRAFKGKPLASLNDALAIKRSLAHGHKRLNFSPCRCIFFKVSDKYP